VLRGVQQRPAGQRRPRPLTHHTHTLIIRGESYRQRSHRKEVSHTNPALPADKDVDQFERLLTPGLQNRVFLKSPVRENRAPGSVRGLLGNWQSYRDGACE